MTEDSIGLFVATFLLVVGLFLGANLGALIVADVGLSLQVDSEAVIGNETNSTTPTPTPTPTPQARWTGYEERPRMLCGSVQRRPSSISSIGNRTVLPHPDSVRNISDAVEISGYGPPNGSKSRWLVQTTVADRPDAAVLQWGTYTANGSTSGTWGFNDAVMLGQHRDSPERHVYWDIRFTNGTVRRYVTRVCLPSDAS